MVAAKEFRLFGQDMKPGEPIPEKSWNDLSERNRRAMVASRFVREESVVPASKPGAGKSKGAKHG